NDRNKNGVIDKGAGEGYEQFTAKYGDADTGFAINGIVQGAGNGRLEENEIINHYYLNIRFKEPEETEKIEHELSADIRASGIPLVWLDDVNGTLMRRVNGVLGVDWSAQEVSAREALRMVRQVTKVFHFEYRAEDISDAGYYSLPEFARSNAGYCFEVAQFYFWFFSQLRINTVTTGTALSPTVSHMVVKLPARNQIVDFFATSADYDIPLEQWVVYNPLQSIAEYYRIWANATNSAADADQAVIYNKHEIGTVASAIKVYLNNAIKDYAKIISLGEFILQNTDIDKVMNGNSLDSKEAKSSLEFILSALISSYEATRSRSGFARAEQLLLKHFSDNPQVRPFIERHRF
ncbi:MAG: hypothetical protein LBK68_05180, partial [Candidatus Margulisbacteria bacterium]|nr:hypothetical protein [Candidatus Margulisiibacteriota bacterium]